MIKSKDYNALRESGGIVECPDGQRWSYPAILGQSQEG